VYAPIWLEIRKNNNLVLGQKQIFKKMQFVKMQEEEVQTVVKLVIQRNSWFAEPGIMICTILASEEREVREDMVGKLLKARKKPFKKYRKMFLR
jgi:hypothetical protein